MLRPLEAMVFLGVGLVLIALGEFNRRSHRSGRNLFFLSVDVEDHRRPFDPVKSYVWPIGIGIVFVLIGVANLLG